MDGNWEVLPSERDGWLKKIINEASKQPAGKQLAIGGVSGWGAGFISGRLGKAAAVTVGGSLLLLQIAHHQGYIQVNWSKMKKDLKKAQRELGHRNRTNVQAMLEEVRDFVRDNVFLAGGFAAGFLIGLAS